MIFLIENCAENRKTVYVQISQLYRKSISDFDKALEYIEKAVSLNREDPSCLLQLDSIYSKKNQYEKAKGYFEEALRLCELQNNNYVSGIIYFQLGLDALSVFDLDKAEKYAYQSLKSREQHNSTGSFDVFLLLSKVEMSKGNYSKSEEYATKVLEAAVELEDFEVKRICYSILSELAVAQRKYREYIQYGEEMALVENDIAKETMLHAAEEMNAKYETAKKDVEIVRQQQVISRQNMQQIGRAHV